MSGSDSCCFICVQGCQTDFRLRWYKDSLGLIVHLRMGIKGKTIGKLAVGSNGMEGSGTNGTQGNTKATSYRASPGR
ncbi:hypothetical protein [Nitrosospira multiformis]|uniref:hypothetical protein n=1 Tax=Nitrosospira multiformis TaxID=1231 RepID=UPI0015A5CD0C|nr:hypothetical protein [Nitrosospira multiformis]